MKRTIKLPCFGIVVNLDTEDPGAGAISSDLHEMPDGNNADGNDYRYDGAMDGIEALILAQACAGIDIESPAYIEAIETAVQACANNI